MKGGKLQMTQLLVRGPALQHGGHPELESNTNEAFLVVPDRRSGRSYKHHSFC